MTYQTEILKASTGIAYHIARMKDSKYKSVVDSGKDFEKFFDKVLEITERADGEKHLLCGLLWYKNQEIKILMENYGKDLKWLTDECLRLGGSMEAILKNICYDALENNHNQIQESKQGDS